MSSINISFIRSLIVTFLCGFAVFGGLSANARTTVDAATIDYFLNGKHSPLAGEGAHFVKWGQYFGIDPRVVVGITGPETTFGTAWDPASEGYNVWNWCKNCDSSGRSTYNNLGFVNFVAGIDASTKGQLVPNGTLTDPLNFETAFEDGIFWLSRQIWLYRKNGINKVTSIQAQSSPYCHGICPKWVETVTDAMETLGGNPNDLTWPGEEVTPQQSQGEDLPRVNDEWFLSKNPYYTSNQDHWLRGECTWYVYGRCGLAGWTLVMKDTNGNTRYPDGQYFYNYITNAAAKDLTPSVGAIMCFSGNDIPTHGHVAYVDQVVDNNTWVINHYNWGLDHKYYVSTVIRDPNNPKRVNFEGKWHTFTGFVHNSVTLPPPPPPPSSPTGLSPDNNVELPTTLQVTLSWNPVTGVDHYIVAVMDLTDNTLRIPGNSCADNTIYMCNGQVSYTSYVLPVRAGHFYQWWVQAVNTEGSSPAKVANFRIRPHPIEDVNGDGKPDILWYNPKTSVVATWLLNGTAIASIPEIDTSDPDWDAEGIADFNGDGKPDILWYNKKTALVAAWLLDGTNRVSTPAIDTSTHDWEMEGTPDLNGDKKPDILWYNKKTALVAAWLLDGTQRISTPEIAVSAPGWEIKGTPDLNGDGKPDILWFNTATFGVAAWLLDGTIQLSTPLIGNSEPDWEIQGTPDLDGDGKPDILWYNLKTFHVAAWLLDGTSIKSTPEIGISSPDWEVKGTPDFNGDGKPDILWYNKKTFEVATWLLDGTTIQSIPQIGVSASDWDIVKPQIYNQGFPDPSVIGDLTDDGVFDARDLTEILQIYLGMKNATPSEVEVGDILPNPGLDGRLYGDGKIGADDINWLFRHFLGLETAS